MKMDAIVVEELRKVFRPGWPGRPTVTALDGLSFSVRRGEIFGFLGPNGAGKTTTLKILMGLMRATSGRAEVFGKPAGDVPTRGAIGFLPESPYFYDYLTAEEFLRFYGQLAGLDGVKLRERIVELLETVGMTSARDRQLRKFSKGMLQRVGLAQALIHDPELVVLDEPMSGLDPIGRKQVRDLILSLRDRGKTVCFSTHILPDVEMICDRVGVVVKGRLLASGPVDELMSRGHTQTVEIVFEGIDPHSVKAVATTATRLIEQGRRTLVVLPGPDPVDEVIRAIHARGGHLVSVTPQKGSLEELFFAEPGERRPANSNPEVPA
jgi:ABC-2 type transport system ATP-binding protein